jgi:hypothetical protein
MAAHRDDIEADRTRSMRATFANGAITGALLQLTAEGWSLDAIEVSGDGRYVDLALVPPTWPDVHIAISIRAS